MTENMNLGAFNSTFKNITEHVPSLVGSTMFYIRNITEKSVFFYETNYQLAWFSADESIGAKVIKPPQPEIFKNSTTSTIIYISQGSTQGVLNKKLQFNFLIDTTRCSIEFTYSGYRKIIVIQNGTEVQKEVTNDGNAVTACNLFSNINLRTIWGYDICIIDIFENDRAPPDINL